jgi:hypothetical protein
VVLGAWRFRREQGLRGQGAGRGHQGHGYGCSDRPKLPAFRRKPHLFTLKAGFWLCSRPKRRGFPARRRGRGGGLPRGDSWLGLRAQGGARRPPARHGTEGASALLPRGGRSTAHLLREQGVGRGRGASNQAVPTPPSLTRYGHKRRASAHKRPIDGASTVSSTAQPQVAGRASAAPITSPTASRYRRRPDARRLEPPCFKSTPPSPCRSQKPIFWRKTESGCQAIPPPRGAP